MAKKGDQHLASIKMMAKEIVTSKKHVERCLTSKAQLNSVLEFHVTNGAVRSTDLKDMERIKTLEG